MGTLLRQDFPLNTVLQGDCIATLGKLPAECADFVLTDPPYLVNYVDRSGRSVANDRSDQWVGPAFEAIARAMRPDTFCVSFYGWSAVDRFFAAWRRAGLVPAGHLTFPKRYASSTRMLRYQHEGAYLLAKGRPPRPLAPIADVIPWTYTGNRLHPTQKPVSILAPLVKSFSPAGGMVLDPFAGSGSSLVAAHACGRAFLGIELDEAMHATARARLQAATARGARSAPQSAAVA